MDLNLPGKVAVVTGAGKGIGLAITRALRLDGFLALTDDDWDWALTVADTSTERFTHPQEVADLVVLLASGRAGNVTGADILIDGGLVKTL